MFLTWSAMLTSLGYLLIRNKPLSPSLCVDPFLAPTFLVLGFNLFTSLTNFFGGCIYESDCQEENLYRSAKTCRKTIPDCLNANEI